MIRWFQSGRVRRLTNRATVPDRRVLPLQVPPCQHFDEASILMERVEVRVDLQSRVVGIAVLDRLPQQGHGPFGVPVSPRRLLPFQPGQRHR